MAHEIENNNGKDMIFVNGKSAWHNLGKPLTNTNDIIEAQNTVYPHSIIESDILASIDGVTELMTEYKGLVRDDGKQIGIVKKSFETVQPSEFFATFKPFIDTGLIDLETGFSLKEGKQLVLLGKIKGSETEVVKNDAIKSYLTMFGGFDGSLSIGVSQTDIRIVCANTLKLAVKQGIDFKFKHTKNVRIKIDEAQSTIMQALANHHKSIEAYKYLASKKISRHEQETYIGKMLLTEQEFKGEKEISPKKENIVHHVIDLLDTQRGLELVPAIRGTAWQAYNAMTEYITHDYGHTDDSRVSAQFFGESAKINQRAFDYAMAM